jgi:hypothetical protein
MHRKKMLERDRDATADDWKGFWDKYSEALSMDINEIHKRVIDGYETGIDEGLPLKWHFDKLAALGFISLDCYWRSDCDAIYGGIISK